MPERFVRQLRYAKKLRLHSNETVILNIADAMVDLGFKDLGYAYVNMDASWDTVERDTATGDLVPDPVLWPSGLNATVDYVHAKGLGFGLYGDKGTLDCAKHPGQYPRERPGHPGAPRKRPGQFLTAFGSFL